jgi:apolipoprotein D and lipocalin family protein
MKNVLVIAIITLTAAVVTMAQASQPSELKTVGMIDLERYAGNWYEIAKYPNRFQKQCVGNTTATYTLKTGGKFEVLNKCRIQGQSVDAAVGEGKIGDKKNNSKLKVRFAPGFLSWLPFVWANYWVIDLGPNYEYAVIGEPKREYLWILSRTSTMDEATYAAIVAKVESMGFDSKRIVKTPQGLTN